MNFTVVVTSINPPNHVLESIAKGSLKNNASFILIGDTKSPKDFSLQNCDYYSIDRQKKLKYSYAQLCPTAHYARKNIGYLIAAEKGADIIVETDDDNIPGSGFWDERKITQKAHCIENYGWVNIYRYFSKTNIWARGFPLEKISEVIPELPIAQTINECPIQQGLADNNPDVDAIYRMIGRLPIPFNATKNIALGKSSWHPFNSQNTTWFKNAFKLMYLPAYCSFRMTDIWRSLIAQRIAWTCDWKILYHQATVYQERNEHNLLKDFEEEIDGYLLNTKISESLTNLNLKRGIEYLDENLLICYDEFIRRQFIKKEREIDLVKAWLKDIASIT